MSTMHVHDLTLTEDVNKPVTCQSLVFKNSQCDCENSINCIPIIIFSFNIHSYIAGIRFSIQYKLSLNLFWLWLDSEPEMIPLGNLNGCTHLFFLLCPSGVNETHYVGESYPQNYNCKRTGMALYCAVPLNFVQVEWWPCYHGYWYENFFEMKHIHIHVHTYHVYHVYSYTWLVW